MEKNLKIFQFSELKKVLKKNSFVLIAVLTQQGDTKNYCRIKKKIYGEGFASIKLTNTVIKKKFNNSIFKRQTMLFSGPLVLLTLICNQKNVDFFRLKKVFPPEIHVLTIKIHYNFFPLSYINKVKTSTYKKSKMEIIKCFYFVLKNLTKQTCIFEKNKLKNN